jgi:undecaprenyl diphosphate synthase
MIVEEMVLRRADAEVAGGVAGGGLHVAIIMDGNGRWATRRGLPRLAGHKAGAQTVRRLTECAAALGIGTLTLFAFSVDNWRRPVAETRALMRLLRLYLARETATCVENGIRLSVIGRRDRLTLALQRLIVETEAATRGGRNLHLRLAIDYSARDAILCAAKNWNNARRADLTRERFAELLGGAHVGISHREAAPDVDLLIRTGGEQRLSDFLLWECAYAELLFTPVMFPDFSAADLKAALVEYANRERRFGSLPPLLSSAEGNSETTDAVWRERLTRTEE